MARVSIYLNFMGTTEAAFTFYKQVFGTEFVAFQRMSEVPADPERPPLPENEQSMVMHVELPILGGVSLMGTDMLESMGHELHSGNNVSINLMPDTLDEGRRLFAALSDGGSEVMPLEPMFWGDYFGTCVDRFGTRWMLNCPAP
jgi:PhnB protein